jgi:hypothetical protein
MPKPTAVFFGTLFGATWTAYAEPNDDQTLMVLQMRA